MSYSDSQTVFLQHSQLVQSVGATCIIDDVMWRDFAVLHCIWQFFHVRQVALQLFQIPFKFGSSVLKPRDHLCVTETKCLRDIVAIGRRQVLLVEETLFQLVYLLICERGARFSALFRWN